MDYIKNQFATYEIALVLKEMGFNEKCFGLFSNKGNLIVSNDDISYVNYFSEKNLGIPAPLLSQAIKWLREVHEIHINVDCFSEKGGTKWDYQIVKCGYDSVGLPGYILTEFADGRNYLSYENALKDGLLESLKWVKFRKEQL